MKTPVKAYRWFSYIMIPLKNKEFCFLFVLMRTHARTRESPCAHTRRHTNTYTYTHAHHTLPNVSEKCVMSL